MAQNAKGKTAKSQSAMEYLMTYGWAILIIAVVLGALFQLGVFNASSFSPRAPPGACQVFRPSGPGTVTNINLMGVCTGQLPQYVAQFGGSGSSVSLGNLAILSFTGSFSVSAWVRPAVVLTSEIGFVTKYGGGAYSWALRSSSTAARFTVDFPDGTDFDSTSTSSINPGSWWFLAGVYDSTAQKVYMYVNGVQERSIGGPASIVSNSNPILIGGETSRPAQSFNGAIADVQIYNASLSANQVQALYLEGMGGAPMKLQNLMGWWPLNGNSGDYSGNNNNGVPTSVAFTSQYGK